MTKKATAFMNVSGGCDSMFYVWRWLQDNPDEHLAIHHCDFSRQRGKAEASAVEALTKFLTQQGIKNFTRLPDTYWTRKGLSGRLLDIEILYFMAGLVLRHGCPSVDTIIMPRCSEEVRSNGSYAQHVRQGGTLDNFCKEGNKLVQAMEILQLVSRRSFSFVSPYQGMTKAQMIEQMPQQLAEALAFCRSPKNGRPCGRCHACKPALPALQKRGIHTDVVINGNKQASPKPTTPPVPPPVRKADRAVELQPKAGGGIGRSRGWGTIRVPRKGAI